MRAQSTPAVEDEGATVRTVLTHIVIEHVVAPEGLAQSVEIVAGQVLLPVEPPEVDTLALTIADDVLEHSTVEGRVFQLPGHAVGRGRKSHIVANLCEMLLIAGHAVGRMEVQTDLQSLLVHPAEQSLRIGYQILVPGPTRPTIQVPVHIHNHHVDGDIVLLDFVGQVHKVTLRIALVLAVPVAKGIEWRHGLASGNLDVVANGLLILVTIAHEIHIDGILVNRCGHPVDAIHLLVEGEGGGTVATLGGRRLVDDRPASTRDDAILQAITLVVAAGVVKGALRTLEVQCILLARIPDDLMTTDLEGDVEVVGFLVLRRDDAVLLITERQRLGLDIEIAALLARGIGRYGQTTIDDGKRGTVFKLRRTAVLDANHLGRQHGEACSS